MRAATTDSPNIARVKQVHAGFARRDWGAVLAVISDTPDWKANFPRGSALGALSGTRDSKEGIASYFANLERLVVIDRVLPERYLDDGWEVIAIVHIHGKLRVSGYAFEDECFQRFSLQDGLLKRIRLWSDLTNVNVAHPSRYPFSHDGAPRKVEHLWGR